MKRRFSVLAITLIAVIVVSIIPSNFVEARTFVTAPEPITSLTVESGDTWYYLSWEAPTGATHYSVRYDTSDYPSDNVSGTEGYFGTETSCNVTGLSSGVGYYFSVFPIAIVGGVGGFNRTITQSKALKESNGWGSVNTIYWDSSQDDVTNSYLNAGITDLESHLETITAREWTVTDDLSSPSTPCIVVSVNATDLSEYGNEAYRLQNGFDGVTITGKTSLAAQHGIYDLLYRLGCRQYFKGSMWLILPDSLPELGTIDIITEPDYTYRSVMTFGGYDDIDGRAATETWNAWNFNYGYAYYQVSHSYAAILDYASDQLVGKEYSSMNATEKQSFYEAHPDAFTGNATVWGETYPDYPWQLDGSNEEVVGWANDYANYVLVNSENASTFWSWNNYRVPLMVATISPNDGSGFNPPYAAAQDRADMVFALANDVSDNISGTYPDKYVGVYSYASYSTPPTGDINNNVLVMLAVGDYNYSSYTDPQRMTMFIDKGAQIGIRDYVDIWTWYKDGYDANDTQIPTWIKAYYALGARYYNGEAAEGWAGHGLRYYFCTKALWDVTFDFDAALSEFYEVCFGDAAETMQDYYETASSTNGTLAEGFRLLDQAMTETSDENVLDRIRYHQAHAYYVWKMLNVGYTNLSDADLEDFYTFATKITDWYVVSPYVVTYLETELDDRGYSAGEITALQDYTTPTDEEMEVYMTEALAEWETYPYVPSQIIDPFSYTLSAYGDTESTEYDNPQFRNVNIIIPSSGNETITINYNGEQGSLLWHDEYAMLYDYHQYDEVADWTSENFTTYAAGNYVLQIPIYYGGIGAVATYVDVGNIPHAFIASDGVTVFEAETSYETNKLGFYGTYTGYFYVPEGTDNFTLGYAPHSTQTINGTITAPNATTHNFSVEGTGEGNGDGGDTTTITSPQAGLWKIEITVSSSAGYFWFLNIPPLTSNDPEYLLVVS